MTERFDFDAWQEQFYNPDKIDNSRYEDALKYFEESRDIFNNPRLNVVSTGKMLSEEEREQLDR